MEWVIVAMVVFIIYFQYKEIERLHDKYGDK